MTNHELYSNLQELHSELQELLGKTPVCWERPQFGSNVPCVSLERSLCVPATYFLCSCVSLERFCREKTQSLPGKTPVCRGKPQFAGENTRSVEKVPGQQITCCIPGGRKRNGFARRFGTQLPCLDLNLRISPPRSMDEVHGQGQRPRPRPKTTARGHGRWPRPEAPWPRAMARGHGQKPWSGAMAREAMAQKATADGST